jgi:hypothetical protein
MWPTRGRNSSVGLASGLVAGVQIPLEAKNVPHLSIVHSDSETHPDYYQEGKAAEM